MTGLYTALALIAMILLLYFSARQRARGLPGRLHSQPTYHGILIASLALLAGLCGLGAARIVALPQAGLLVCALAASGLTGLLLRRRISPVFPARPYVEMGLSLLTGLAASLAILITLGIVFSLIFESLRFFHFVGIGDFLLGLHWSPQIAIRADQVASSGAFGAVPVFLGTLVVTLVALAIAVPSGLLAAVYLANYAGERTRAIVKPAIEILAGIPTVVYGFFAAIVVGPRLHEIGEMLGIAISNESALAAGGVMGIMIIPFVSSLSDDVMRAVPRGLREGSLALGATLSETIRRVVIPAALPGIAGGILLATSRAIGETMIVVMAAGLAAHLTLNPLSATTTVTVQIVTLLTGDQEFDSPKTLVAFALGLTLFVLTLLLNIGAQAVVARYRERYE
ncbi:MAG TPA: phosphate ABC transporter permease subunit PstC [Dongiaceae bacterium]|jgi:phosphate transport system permease protein|nr:phosphate ABC transporter permease subunit PstC [Dongiaceae bacterium]